MFIRYLVKILIRKLKAAAQILKAVNGETGSWTYIWLQRLNQILKQSGYFILAFIIWKYIWIAQILLYKVENQDQGIESPGLVKNKANHNYPFKRWQKTQLVNVIVLFVLVD